MPQKRGADAAPPRAAKKATRTPKKPDVEMECPGTAEVPARVDADPGPAPAPADDEPKVAYAVGDVIEARWKGGSHWHAGRVTQVNPPKTKTRDPTFDVLYDDGDEEARVPLHLIRVDPEAAPPAGKKSKKPTEAEPPAKKSKRVAARLARA